MIAMIQSQDAITKIFTLVLIQEQIHQKNVMLAGLCIMNELTKEELVWLRDELQGLINILGSPPIGHRVLNKLISMAESCCEHESVRPLSEVDYVFVCAECNEAIKYE